MILLNLRKGEKESEIEIKMKGEKEKQKEKRRSRKRKKIRKLQKKKRRLMMRKRRAKGLLFKRECTLSMEVYIDADYAGQLLIEDPPQSTTCLWEEIW